MDDDLYPWSNIVDRAPVAWRGGSGVAVPIVVSLAWFPILPVDTPFPAPGHMQSACPDHRHDTSRDDAAAGLTVSVATNAAIAHCYLTHVRDIVAAGHQIVAHEGTAAFRSRRCRRVWQCRCRESRRSRAHPM